MSYDDPAHVRLREARRSRGKLQQVSATSALMSGFALVAMVELPLPVGRGSNPDQRYDGSPVIVAFGVVTALFIAINLFALLVSTCVLPYLEEEEALAAALAAGAGASPAARMPSTGDFSFYIELAWLFTTGLGVVLFLADLMLIAWIKFVDHTPWAGWAVFMVLGPTSLGFAWFVGRFYLKIVRRQIRTVSHTIQDLTEGRAKLAAALEPSSRLPLHRNLATATVVGLRRNPLPAVTQIEDDSSAEENFCDATAFSNATTVV
jgi:hypothetical protein